MPDYANRQRRDASLPVVSITVQNIDTRIWGVRYNKICLTASICIGITMDLHLQDRVAAVAGASAGLGFASALTLAQEGCKVALCSRRPDRLQEAAALIRTETKVEVLVVPADMGTPSGPIEFVQRTVQHFGQLDIAVANAGGPPSGPFAAKSDAEWEYAVQLNLLSAVRMFRTALPTIQKSDQGRLIAITSMSAKHPLENMVLSNATRAGVHGIVKTLSREVADTGITVNAVCPGVTKTDRLEELAQQEAEQTGITVAEAHAKRAATVPMGRLGDPMEFGAAVAFLCSRQAAFISGVGLLVDGGFMGGMP